MTITTQDCKNFIKENAEIVGHDSNRNWKRTRKYKEGNLILRDFSNDRGEVLTVCEDENQQLSFHNKKAIKSIKDTSKNTLYSNWFKLLTHHYSQPCYEDQSYSSQEMLDECLATIQHGMQHNDFKEKEIYFKIEGKIIYLIVPNMTDLEDEVMSISVEELKSFGYSPKKNQSAYDFVDENWNWY